MTNVPKPDFFYRFIWILFTLQKTSERIFSESENNFEAFFDCQPPYENVKT